MAAEIIGLGIFGMMFFFMFLLLPVGIILAMVFWVFMIIDAANRKFKNDNDKIVWVLIIALLNFLGAAIYYFVIKLPDKH